MVLIEELGTVRRSDGDVPDIIANYPAWNGPIQGLQKWSMVGACFANGRGRPQESCERKEEGVQAHDGELVKAGQAVIRQIYQDGTYVNLTSTIFGKCEAFEGDRE